MHKKRVSGKDYFYTTVRKGDKTDSVYLGRDYNSALSKEKVLKNPVKRNDVFLIDLVVIIAVLVAFAFLLKLPFTGYVVYDVGNVSLDINMFVSSNSYLMVDNVSMSIPFELIDNNGSLGYNVTTLVLSLDEGEHTINLIDNEEVVYNKVITIGADEGVPDVNATLPEENISVPVVNITEPVLPEINLTLPEENISVPTITEDVPKVYIRPNINVISKGNKKGRHNLVDKGNNKFDLDADLDGNALRIRNLKTTKNIDVVFGRLEGHKSDFVFAEIDDVESAEVRLRHDKIAESGITSGKKPVLVCDNFDVNTLDCGGWSYSGVDAYDDNGYYIFNVTHFSAFRTADSITFDDINACLFFVNGTSDYCRLNDLDMVYNLSGSQVWLDDSDLYEKNNMFGGMIAGYNFSDIGGYTTNDVSLLGYNGYLKGAVYTNQSNGISVFSAGSNNAQDVTTNGSDIWIVDITDDAVYHFNALGVNQTDGFVIGNPATGAGAGSGTGITTNGSDFWVTDNVDDFAYHFNALGVNQSDGFSTGDIGSGDPYGIATDGTDFWIVDNTDKFVYHVNALGVNQSDGFSTAGAGATDPWGIAVKNNNFFVLDFTDKFVYHFDSSGVNQSDGFSTNSIGSQSPTGIEINGIDMWLSDNVDEFAYHLKQSNLEYRTLNTNSSALQFDGLNDFINITGSDENLLFNYSNFTFEAWVKPSQIKQQLIFDRRDDSFAISTRLIMLAAGTLRFSTRTSTTNSCDTGATLTADRWYHIATTYNETTKEVYVNGMLNKTCLHSGHLLASDDMRAIIIGATSSGTTLFNGTMDEIAFYNFTLNATEISKHAWGHYNAYETRGGGTTGTGAIEFFNHNQTLDCAGKTLSNIGNGDALDLSYFASNNDELENTTIMNCNLNWFYQGIDSDGRNLIVKNTEIKNTVAEGVILGVGEVAGDYITYFENVTVVNSSTEEGMQANAGGLTNITITDSNFSYSKKENIVLSMGYFKIINSYIYNSTTGHCAYLSGAGTLPSVFTNNTIRYCLSDDKAGLGLVNIGSAGLLIENNTMNENNINIITNTVDNITIRNNSLGASYELDYSGSGIGANIAFLDKSANITFTGNNVRDSGENALVMGNLGGGPIEYINVSNNSFYNTSSGWDLYLATADVYNVSVWLNHFYRAGVNDVAVLVSRPNFSVYANGVLEGNFYNESIVSASMGWNEIGPLNITTANLTFFYSNLNNTIEWKKQSSFKTIRYLLEYNLTTDYASAGNTTDVSFNWIPAAKNNYIVRIKPNDGEYNGTVKYMSIIMDMINPDISFIDPTPGNNTAQAATAIYVNTTSSDDYVNRSVILDWNRTLIAWWRMNNESGENSSYIKDWSFYENNGTAKNGTASACGVSMACPFYTQEGKIGGGFKFDSLGDYIQVADNDVLDINYDNFSIGFWFKTNNNAALQRLIIKSDTNGYKGYRFDILATGKVYFEVEGTNPNYQSVQSINSITAGTWYHVVGVRKDDTAYLYLDGVLQGSDSTPSLGGIGSINDILYIGSWFGTSGYFNGTIDEIQIYKRALSSAEINASFNASSYNYTSNFTNLFPDRYLFRAYAQDFSGNTNNTFLRSVRVDKSPYSNVTILPFTAYTNSILNATFHIMDDDNDKMNVSLNWWNGSVLYLGKTYENNLTNTFLSFNLSSTPQHEGEVWNASIDIYDSYMNFTNSTTITILNSPPHIPILNSPTANSTTTTRKPTFTWTGADNDTETIYYDVLVDDSSEFTSPVTSYNQTAISFTPSSVLKADTVYYWKVRANDDTNVSSYSEVWNITVASYVSILMPTSSSNYGSKSIGDSDDTTDGTPAPMQIENDGNVFLNVTVYGVEALFNRVGLGNSNFRIKARNSTEVPSYDEIASQTDFFNVPVTAAAVVDMINYTNATDLVNIDTEVTVPLDEPDGARGSNLIFTASLGEGNL